MSKASFPSAIQDGSRDSGVEESDWVLLEEDSMKGVNIIVDHNTGEVVALSTRYCADEDRWSEMPSVERFASLRTLDLHNSRYLTELHESVTNLPELRQLIVTRCTRLERFPDGLGRNINLREVHFKFCLAIRILYSN